MCRLQLLQLSIWKLRGTLIDPTERSKNARIGGKNMKVETNQKMGKRNRVNRKILIIIAFSVGIVIEYIIIRKDTSGGITGLVALIECLSILPKRKER